MPEVLRAEIVEAARSYVGVKYSNAGRTREDGLSCAGVLVAVGRDLGFEVDDIPGFSEFNEAEPMDRWLNLYADKLDGAEDAQEGDIVTMLRDELSETDQHCAILVERNERPIKYWYFVHSLRNHGVVEGRLFGRYLRGVTGAWRIRGVID